MSNIKRAKFQAILARTSAGQYRHSVRQVIEQPAPRVRSVVSMENAQPIIRTWLTCNNGEPFGRVLAVTASGIRYRVVRVFIHERHGLTFRLREEWAEDGGLCTQDHDMFASNIESIEL